MTRVVPVAAYRSRVESTPGGIEATIPMRRNYFLIAVMAFWLFFWAHSLFQLAPQIQHPSQTMHNPPPPELFPIFIVVWIIGGVFAVTVFFWNLAGRERIALQSGGDLTIRREVFGLGWTRHYELSAVKALRVVESGVDAVFGLRQSDPFGVRGGPFAFDYGAKTIRFGAGLEVAEAKYVLSKLIAAKPALAEQA